jgi:hypothetical protein
MTNILLDTHPEVTPYLPTTTQKAVHAYYAIGSRGMSYRGTSAWSVSTTSSLRSDETRSYVVRAKQDVLVNCAELVLKRIEEKNEHFSRR